MSLSRWKTVTNFKDFYMVIITSVTVVFLVIELKKLYEYFTMLTGVTTTFVENHFNNTHIFIKKHYNRLDD